MKRNLVYHPQSVDLARELRKNATPAERKLWNEYLRQFPYRVLRQRPIGEFIVDFYCARLRLVIEVDGGEHYSEEGLQADQRRTQYLEGLGLKVIRFTNRDVLEHFEDVCREIESYCVGGEDESPQPPLGRGA